jgi:DNA polymerase-3 subunit gamma/tau
MSLALARKYRPRNFASVAVQSHVSTTLKGAIAHGRVAHGYLLCGPRGTGKTTLARVLAMALNCERRAQRTDGEPCGECISCQRIWSGSASLDVVEIDAASNRGVDDARDLRERAMYAPSGDDRWKVYIVDEAHMLTREAWNALLKILEEPPSRVVFVFATTEPQKIAQSAAPVMSRLQRFDLKRIGPADIRARLADVLKLEGTEASADALAMLARAADGSMRDALSLTDQVLALGGGSVTAERVREALGLVAEDEYIAVLDLIAQRRAGDIFTAIHRLVDLGIDLGAFLTGFADILRAQLEIGLGGPAADLSEHARAALEARRQAFTPVDLLRMLNALTELEPRFRRSGQQQLLLETILVRFALLDRSVELEEVLRGLGGQGGAVGVGPAQGGATGRAPSTPAPAPTRAAPEPPAGSRRGSSPAPADGIRSAATSPPSPPSPPPQATAPVLADAPPDTAGHADPVPLDLNRLAERWDDVVDRLRRSGKVVLASAVEHAIPVSVTGSGVVSLQLDEANEVFSHAIESGRDDLLRVVGEWFSDARGLQLRPADSSSAPVPPRRLTAESIRADRVASLRKRDPLLSAAIDALDLDLLE